MGGEGRGGEKVGGEGRGVSAWDTPSVHIEMFSSITLDKRES